MRAAPVQLGTALVAVRAAASAVLHVGDPQAFPKGAAGPATVADLAGQVAATLVLHERCGLQVRLAAEESWDEVVRCGGAGLMVHVARAVRATGLACDEATCERILRAGRDEGGTGAFWALDPLDGTKGYLRGGQFAVALALIIGGTPALGVLAAPRLGLQGTAPGAGVLFAAMHGEGAWQSPLVLTSIAEDAAHPAASDVSSDEQVPLHCAAWSPGMPIRVAGSVEAAHSDASGIEAALARVGSVQHVRMDSQVKYGLVARGGADVYARRSPSAGYAECIWDHAAGALIAQEAGCMVSDLHGRPLCFHQGRRLSTNMGVLCCPPLLHREALRACAATLG